MDRAAINRDADHRHLRDVQEIIDLTARYCWALDTKDWDALGTVFLPSATADLGRGGQQGLAEITARIASTLDPLDNSQHMVNTHQVVVDGDTATCRCYLHAQHIRTGAEGGDLYVAAGRYEDQLLRTPEGWRIQHRDLTVMWTEGNRAVVHP